MEKSRQHAHFSVTLKLLFKPVILSFVYCKILFFVWTRYFTLRLRENLIPCFNRPEVAPPPGFPRGLIQTPLPVALEDFLEIREVVLLIAATRLMITRVLCVQCACVTLPLTWVNL